MSDDQPTSPKPRRRTVVKLLGAGGVLSAFGGVATAQEGDETGTPTEPADDGDGTVHEVQTLIGPPTNPDRPADFFYQPTGLHVQPGDVVEWVFTTPDHNVVSYHPAFGMRRRVPLGVDAFSSPLLGWQPDSIPDDQIEPPAEPGIEGEATAETTGTPPADEAETPDAGEPAEAEGPVPDTWLHAFETPGVYDVLCSPHETFGMAMRVVVGDVTETAFETSNPENLPEPRAGPVGLARVTLTDPALQPSNVVEQGEVAWQSLQANQPVETPTPTETGTPPEE